MSKDNFHKLLGKAISSPSVKANMLGGVKIKKKSEKKAKKKD